MTALLVALGFAALLSLQPWPTSSVAPGLSVAPALKVGLGDAVAVAPAQGLAVAPARPAMTGGPRLASNHRVAFDDGDHRQTAGIAPARPVPSVAGGRPTGGSPKAPTPASPPLPVTPEAVPVAAPIAPSPSPTQPIASSPPQTPTDYGRPGAPSVSGMDPGEDGAVEVSEGDEYAFSFSFLIQPTAYRPPGEENLIVRFRGEASDVPSFGLPLWDDGGDQRGLWASGDAMGGERFLAPVAEGEWHEAVICFRASSEGDGFYLLLLDGELIDARARVSLIDDGSGSALIETGLFREGEGVVGAPDVFLGPTRLGEALEPAIP
jgi:hypothetical protein